MLQFKTCENVFNEIRTKRSSNNLKEPIFIKYLDFKNSFNMASQRVSMFKRV